MARQVPQISPGGGGGARGGSYARSRAGNPPPNRGGGLKTTTGQRRVKVSNKDAKEIARESKKSYRARAIAKRVGTLSANENRQVTKVDTITRPKPLTKQQLQARKELKESKPELRNSLIKTVNPARHKPLKPDTSKPKAFNPNSPERIKMITLKRLNAKMDKLQPRPTGPNVRPFTKAQAAHRAELLRNAKARLERVKAESKTRLTAEQRLKLKNAASNPENSTAPAPRKNAAEMLADKDRALKAAGKVKTLRPDGKVRAKRVRSPESVQRNLERKDDRQQGKDARRDPKRYEHPLNDRGPSMNIRMKEIVEKADAAIKTASARKAAEREKIAKTPAAKAKVDATLAAKKRADKAEAARNVRNTLRNRTGKPGLRSGGIGGSGGLINRNNR
jgi:hypothetical protein